MTAFEKNQYNDVSELEIDKLFASCDTDGGVCGYVLAAGLAARDSKEFYAKLRKHLAETATGYVTECVVTIRRWCQL